MLLISYAYEPEVNFLRKIIKKEGLSSFVAWQRFPAVNRKILANQKLKLILNVGFAGALNQGLALGQVVLVDQIIDETAGACEVVDSLAKEFAAQQKIPFVKLLTSKDSVTDSSLRDELREKTGADIVDMEGFTLFKVAQSKKLPIASFKVVSDNADNDAWQMVKQNADKWSEALGQTAYHFLVYYEDKRVVKGDTP